MTHLNFEREGNFLKCDFLEGKKSKTCSRVLNHLYFLTLYGMNLQVSHITTTDGTVYSLTEPLWLVTTFISPLLCSVEYEKGNFLPCYIKPGVNDLLLAFPDPQNL